MTKTSKLAIAALVAATAWTVPALAKPNAGNVAPTWSNGYNDAGSLADRQSFFYRQ